MRTAATTLQTLGAHLRARSEWYWAPLVYALGVAALYHQVWSGTRGFGWDTIESYWPDLSYFSGQIVQGRWPLWNPYDRGGYPIYADPQAAAYYPVQWLLAAIGGALGGVSWWLIQIKALLHHAIAGATMHAFLRSRGLPVPAALVGGFAWIASAPMLIHKASNVLHPMVWTPLIWLAIDAVIARPSWRRGCALAAALYLAGSAGSPPGFFYALLMAAAYGAYRVTAAVTAAGRRDRRELLGYLRRLGVALGVAAAVSLAALAIIVVPAMELAEHTPRAQRGLAYALMLPLPVAESLIGLFSPHLGNHDSYPGILALMLAVCALAVRPLRDRGAPIFFFFAGAFFLVLGFGAATPLLAWLVEHVPGFGLFRISNRYKLLFAPMFAVLAAYGAASLLDAARSWSRERLGAVVAVALTVGIVLVLSWRLDPPRPNLRPEGAAILLAVLAAGLVLGALIHQRRAAGLLVLVMPVLTLYATNYYVHHPRPILENRPPTSGEPALLATLDGVADHRYRVYDEYVMAQRAGSRRQIRDFRGYPSGDPLDLRRYQDVLRVARNRPEVLEVFNVRYVLHGPHHRNHTRLNHVSRPPDRTAPAHFRRVDDRVHEATSPAPLVAWYGALEIASAGEVLGRLLAVERVEGARAVAVIEPDVAGSLGARATALARAAAAPPAMVAGELVSWSPNRIRARIDAPGPGLVILNEVAYPGWRVTVDGRPAAPLTANYLLRGVAVDGGAHELEWRFSPSGYRALLAAWLLGLGALAGAGLLAWRRRRRAEPA